MNDKKHSRVLIKSRPLYEVTISYPRWLLMPITLGVVASLIAVIIVNPFEQETSGAKNLSYDTQMNNLKQIEGNLNNLVAYIGEQKSKLKESEDLLNSLKTEKQKLEPLVKADRDVVSAIFDFQSQMNKRSEWKGYSISFILGVLSSVLAGVIILAFTSRKKQISIGNNNL